MVDFGFLGSAINQTLGTGENNLHSLDIVKNGKVIPNGLLGDFAKQIDQTADRQYTEEGFTKTSLFNPTPNFLEQWWQEPDITILVKKRAFSSLAENYRPDLMNEDERLFLRATKFLFQNKCKQIAAYEQLTKIEAVVKDIGAVDTYLLPAIFAATDTLDSAFSALGSSAFSGFKSIVDKIRTVINLSNAQNYTTWWTNVQNSFKSDLGEGTGVIEFTTVSNLRTTTSVNFGGGSFDLMFTDPHNLMRITHNDIEQAIADASNVVYGNSFIQLGLNTLNTSINSDKKSLNQVRAARGANPINFLVEPNTFLGKRVRAIIDGSGTEIQFNGSVLACNIDPAYLQPTAGGDLTTDALSTSEAQTFSRIVKSIFNAMQINQNSTTTAKAHNAKTNGLRKKLMLHYGQKCIIQPMDVVHIFIDSKTKTDNKILGGLQDSFNALGFLQNANNAMVNLQDFFNAATGNSVEKDFFVGSDFPNWLWLIMRNQFVADKSGTQVFAGLVEQADFSFDASSGAYTLKVMGKDNTAYFDCGVVNIKPSLDVWNGSLYDPITPFDIKFDQITGLQPNTPPQLLQENQQLFNSAFIKYKNGIYVGKQPTVNNFIQDTEKAQTNSVRQVFYDPDGMVYKWKEGIGTLVMSGNNYQDTNKTTTGIPPLTKDPFAGQDVMNTLSLLITGEPYNFATFYKAATDFDGFGRDPITGQDPAVSYFRNLQADLKKNNLLYGNFVPYKKLTMNQDTFTNAVSSQIKINGFDNELNTLLEQAADLNDRIAQLTNFSQNTNTTIDSSNLQNQLAIINTQITAKQNQIATELNQINSPLSIVGNNTSLDYNSFLGVNSKNDLSNASANNKELRRKMHFLTRRLSYKVRANEDINMFIVDDQYDKDYDIQAFEKDFTDASIFKSEYITVGEKIKKIAEILDLEVFANTQGHIEIRAPKYNMMPSSVFYRMLRLKQEFDIQLYPQFIEDQFVNQIDNILSQIEVIEDQIRMYGLALAISDDQSLANFINSSQSTSGAISSANFTFISDDNGNISPVSLPDLSQTQAPDAVLNTFSGGLNALDTISTQATINGILSSSSRQSLLQQTTSTLTGNINAILSNQATQTREEQINNRLQVRTGQTFDLSQLFPNSASLNGRVSQVDLLKILEEITQLVQDRQRMLKIAASTLSKAKEGLSLLKNDNQIGNSLLISGSPNNSNLPAAFEGFIEDESYDDYGPGSGARYVIKDAFIKNISITETRPPFTAIDVQSNFGDNFISESSLPGELNGFIQGGNALTTASAIDYDMWRMYGIMRPQSIPAPYLTNPDTQCAPFAVALLNKARKQINNGSSISIIGNEYMQPGEVVYVENLDTLFYVETVSHNFSYGKSFNTNLNVGYAHMPGQYIPTYLDVIGKILYKNKDITNLVHKKDGAVDNSEHIGTIVGNINSGSTSISDSVSQSDIMTGTFGDENAKTLTAALAAAQNVFITAGTGTATPIMELRIFFASNSSFSSPNPNAQSLAAQVQGYLTGSNNMFSLIKTPQPNQQVSKTFNIQVVPVDSSQTFEFRTPSTSAYYMARRALTKTQGSTQFNSQSSNQQIYQIDQIINGYIVDIWINYENNIGPN